MEKPLKNEDVKDSQIKIGGTAREPETVKKLHRLGLSLAEIPIQDTGIFNELLPDFAELRISLNMEYVCHGPREGDPNDRETLKKIYLPQVISLFPYMEQLQMPLLTIHLYLDPRFVRKEILEYKKSILKEIIREAETRDIILCIENLSENADHMERFFNEIPGLNLTLDLGHGQLLTGKNTGYDFISKWPDRIHHVHLHDNLGGNSHLDDLHLPLGQGIIDFKGILGALIEAGYKKTITLELTSDEIEQCLDRVKALLNRERT